ncbi:MAG: hypothetical protein ACOCV1_03065 [Bacillota bacterium]
MKTYKQYINENSSKIDYDNDSFNDIWIYEKRDPSIQNMNIGLITDQTGKFYDRTNDLIFYLEDGKYHREDGPAKIYSYGGMLWYNNGVIHREDGPALINANEDYKEWIIYNQELNGKVDVPEKMQKIMIDYDPDDVKLIPNLTYELQEYVILNYPESIKYIQNINPELVKKYDYIFAGEDLGV